MLPRVGGRCQGRGSPCSSPQGALWDPRLPGAGGVGPQGTRSALRHLGPGLHRVSGELGGGGGRAGVPTEQPDTHPQVRGADGGAPVRSGAPAGAVPADPGGAIPAVPSPLTPRLRPPSPRAGPRTCGTAQSAGHTGPQLLHPGVGLAGGGAGHSLWGHRGSPALAPQGFTPATLPPRACRSPPVFVGQDPLGRAVRAAAAALARGWPCRQHQDSPPATLERCPLPPPLLAKRQDPSQANIRFGKRLLVLGTV